jgi:restriction system protein
MGLGGGSLLAALLVWWVWRSRVQLDAKAGARPRYSSPTVRLGDVPSQTELESWPVERLRLLVTAQFEATGYLARVRENGSDADLELLRPGHTKPSVLICCRAGSAGVVGTNVVRELFGTLISNGIQNGWIISAAQFSPDAQALATERGIELIDGAGLIERLQALDQMALAQVLERVGA